MKRKSLCIITFMLVVALLFSSCESRRIVNTVDSLLTPPLYYTEYEGLVDAFNEYAGINPSLITPSSGDYTSAITVEDVDGDDAEEAIVTYKDSGSETFACVCFLQNTENGWQAVESFTGYGDEIYSVDIDDLDNDGVCEIMIAWAYSGITGGYVYSAYTHTSSGGYNEIKGESCDAFDLIDIDADGNKEIFLITSSTEAGVVSRKAKAFGISGGKISLKGSVAVDPGVIAYNPITVEGSGEGVPPVLYIDAVKSDKQMITEMIVWNSETKTLTAPLCDETTGANLLSLRYEQITSFDVNSDGKIEIPVQTPYGESAEGEENSSSDLYLTRWIRYENGKTKNIMNSFVNPDDGYLVNLDGMGLKKTGVTKYTSRNCWIIYNDDGKSKIGNELFTILRVSNKRWSSEDMSSYIRIASSTDGVICVYPTQKGKGLGYDEAKIKKIIIPLQEVTK